ncbi:MAG: hypothetical protein KQH83_06325 [Actinobacteria bacterium]|nr:hypothetical protein [Actinomycetota bacterium]
MRARGAWKTTTWALLAFNVAMAFVVVFAIPGACEGHTGAALEACRAGEYGFQAGRVLAIAVWLWIDVLAGLGWIAVRLLRRLRDRG